MADQDAQATSSSTEQSTSRQRGAGNSSMVESVQAKAQEVLMEDFDKFKTVASDAVRSQSYLYPIKGIIYFATHRALWKPLMTQLLPYLGLSIGVTASMFFFTYLPQLAVLVFVNGPLAVFTTVLLVLNESATITNVVAKSWLLQESLLDTFDGTLVARDCTAMVETGRDIKSGSDPIAKLGKILRSPFERFSPKALVRYLIYLPLNFIPVVGTVIFILIQGRTRGQMVHGRYFQLKQWSVSQREDWMHKHAGPYSAFGLVATVLEMVPVASILFAFTNTVAAALWAADIEAKSTSMTDSTAPTLRETASKAD